MSDDQAAEIVPGEEVASMKQMFNRLMEEMGTMRKEFAKCLTNVDELKTRVEKVESAVDALSRNLAEVDSEVTLNSGTPQLNELKKSVQELKEKNCVLENQVGSLLEDFPKLQEEGAWSTVESRRNKRDKLPMQGTSGNAGVRTDTELKQVVGESFGKWCEDKPEGTILLVGDSMVRGVGRHLERDNVMFSKLDFAGAKIEDVEKKIRIVGDRGDSHLVVWAGTNNLKTDTAAECLGKYESLLRAIKARKYRKTTVMGICERTDLNKHDETKRIIINVKVSEMCTAMGIEYLEPCIGKWTMLDSRGLHLNWKGQDHVAKSVFKHCIKHLN